MSLFKMKRGQESKVSSLAKEDGSLIFSLNGANDSTVRLDQSVNGTVQRLGIAVDKAKSADSASNASSANYAKNADTIDGFHYSEAPYKYSKTFNQPVSNAVWYLKVRTSDWNNTSETITVRAGGNNRTGSIILKVGSRQANWWGYATQYNGTCLTGVKVIISNSNDTYLRFDEGTTWATIYTTFSATIETSTVTDGYISIPGEGGIFGNAITGTFKGTADNSNALGGSSLAQVLSAAGSGKFLPLAGGNMTGDIGYAGSKATYSMIKFIDNKADTYGNGIAIGGGGLTIIGGGESAAVIAAQHSSGGDENMVVANDDSIDFYTNCQNGFASAKHITMNTDGSVTASTFNGFATNSDKLDGYHENSFLRYRGATATSGQKTLWNQIGIQEYDNCYPDGLTNGIYGYGEVISLPSRSARFDLWVNHNSSNQISNGLQYRSGWDNDKKSWRMILDSVNYTNYAATKNSYNSASISDATIKLGRSDGSTGTTLVVNNVANAASASVAKLISPFENATANVSRNVWFSDSAVRNKATYNDNFKYNPVTQELTAIATTSKYATGGESESNYQLNSTQLHQTIDLTSSTYNQNTWYPVVGSSLPYRGYSRIICYVQLNSGTKPSWSTHGSGFTCNLDVLAKAGGWGTTNAGSIVLDYSWSFTQSNVSPISYQQLTNSSCPVIWMRGGGKYFIRSSEKFTWTVKTSSYAVSSQTVAPQTSCPVLSLTRSTIYANINGSVSSAGSATNASTAEYAKNAGKLGGIEASKYAKKEDIPAIPSNLDVANRLQSYNSAGNVDNSLFYRYGVLSSSWSNFPVSSLPSTGIGANFQGKNTGVLHIAAGSSYHDLAFTAGAKDNQGILYAGTGRNPAYILDTENYKTKGNVFNSLTANTSFTAKVNVTIDGGSY